MKKQEKPAKVLQTAQPEELRDDELDTIVGGMSFNQAEKTCHCAHPIPVLMTNGFHACKICGSWIV